MNSAGVCSTSSVMCEAAKPMRCRRASTSNTWAPAMTITPSGTHAAAERAGRKTSAIGDPAPGAAPLHAVQRAAAVPPIVAPPGAVCECSRRRQARPSRAMPKTMA